MDSLDILISKSRSGAENLALEEHLLSTSTRDILLFYINEPCVVIGKHQNPWLEVDLNYCRSNNIKLFRRLTGGGTVYHDEGNINFSFIRNKTEDFVNFRKHIEPIQKALLDLGIDCSITQRNDLFVKQNKISGNAQHVSNQWKRIIHHGTLLYDANKEHLSKALNALDSRIETHAVASVRSKVINISEMKDLGSPEQMLETVIGQLRSILDVEAVEQIDPSSVTYIQQLVKKKYLQWSWTFGHSPQFSFHTEFGDEITVRKGSIIQAQSDRLSTSSMQQLIGLTFHTDELIQSGIDKKTAEQICLPS